MPDFSILLYHRSVKNQDFRSQINEKNRRTKSFRQEQERSATALNKSVQTTPNSQYSLILIHGRSTVQKIIIVKDIAKVTRDENGTQQQTSITFFWTIIASNFNIPKEKEKHLMNEMLFGTREHNGLLYITTIV